MHGVILYLFLCLFLETDRDVSMTVGVMSVVQINQPTNQLLLVSVTIAAKTIVANASSWLDDAVVGHAHALLQQ